MAHAKLMYGWDLLYNSVQSKISKKDDVLMVFVHWCLTKKGFRCIGVGSEKAFNSSEVGSETLPDAWNTTADGNYALRYIHDKILYVLCGTRTGDVLVLNLLRCSDYTVSSVIFKVEEEVAASHGPLEVVIPSYQNVMHTIQSELIVPVYDGHQRTAHTQTQKSEASNSNTNRRPPPYSEDPDADPLRVGQPRRALPHGFDPIFNPLNVGHNDLDPLGGMGGGGMLFNPFAPGRGGRQPGTGNLPPGAVPPGARFDPFSPISPGPVPGRPQRPGGFQPDPDHLPPPGYDDMFM